MQYRTRAGDRLDLICQKHYQRQAGVVEAVLQANPGLAARGPILPEDWLLELPDLPEAARPPTVRLWE